VKALPKVGEGADADIEAIAALQPRAVYLGPNTPEIEAKLEELEIPMVIVPEAKNINDIYFTVNFIALAEGYDAQGMLENLKNLAGEKPSKKVKAYIEVTGGLQTIGGESFFNDILEHAGIENIFKNEKKDIFQTAYDDIIKKSPEIIISFNDGQNFYLPPQLKKLRIINLISDIFYRPTPTAVRGIPVLQDILNKKT
jgi:ABC-type Fe3+-hydroxamate transport system substrate-binding protein